MKRRMTTSLDNHFQNETAVNILRKKLSKNDLNQFEIEQIFNKKENLSTIYYILKKRFKTPEDAKVVSSYILTLDNFISAIKSDKDTNEKIDYRTLEIIYKISGLLKVETIEGNRFLMKIGDRGDKFFIILRGSVSVLIPKIKEIRMSKDEYTSHLKMLYNLNEQYLYQETLLRNRCIFSILEKDIEVIDDSIDREINSIDDYINKISASGINNQSYYPYVTIVCYFKVALLEEGNSFGEIAIINENQLRTASIYANEKCIFGTVDNVTYKMSIKSLQEKIKRERAFYILSTGVFDGLEYRSFIKKIWNSFAMIKLKQGDFLFRDGDCNEKLYFLNYGQLLLYANLSGGKIINIIYSLKGLKCKDNIKNYNDTEVSNLTIIDSKDVIGFEDIVIEGKYFCNCQVISKNAILFGINIQMLLNDLNKFFPFIIQNYHKKQQEKKDIMIKTLEDILKMKNVTIIGENKKQNEGSNKYKNLFSPEPKKKIRKIVNSSYTIYKPLINKKKKNYSDNNNIKLKSPLFERCDKIKRYTNNNINDLKSTEEKNKNKSGSLILNVIRKYIKKSEANLRSISHYKDKQSPHYRRVIKTSSFKNLPSVKENQQKEKEQQLSLINSINQKRRAYSAVTRNRLAKSKKKLFKNPYCSTGYDYSHQKLNTIENDFFVSKMRNYTKDNNNKESKNKNFVVNYVDCLIMEKKNNDNITPMSDLILSERNKKYNRFVIQRGIQSASKRINRKTLYPLNSFS